MANTAKIRSCDSRHDPGALSGVKIGGGPITSLIIRDYSTGQTIVLFVLVLSVGWIPVLAAWREGLWDSPRLKLPMNKDIAYFNQFCFMLPIVVFFFREYFRKLPAAIGTLFANGVFANSSHEQIIAANTNLKRQLRHPFFIWFPFSIGAVGVMIGSEFFLTQQGETWLRPNIGSFLSLAGWLQVPLVFLNTFLIGAFFARLLAAFIVLRRLFQLPVRIFPLHVDECGGLAPLGQSNVGLYACSFLFSIIVLVGVEATVANWGLDYFSPLVWGIVAAYVICMAVVFFAPLYSVHTAMSRERACCVNRLARAHSIEQERLLELIAHAESAEADRKARLPAMENAENEFEMRSRRLEVIRYLHETAIGMPVFPFNRSNLRAFLLAVCSPLFLRVVEAAGRWYLSGSA